MPQRRNGNPPERAKPSLDTPVNRLASTAHEAAGTVGQLATDALSTAGQKADDMAASLGGSMQSLAGNLRASTPSQEPLGPLAAGMADVLDRAGQYLRDEGVSGLAGDLHHLIRRHPLAAIFVAAGVGFLLAQTTRR
jgi:hypothetical protein